MATPPPLPEKPNPHAWAPALTVGEEAPRLIEYARPGIRQPRPGALIAIGIISVLLGLLGIGANAAAVIAARRLYALSLPVALPPAPKPLPPATVAPYTGDLTGARGLPRAERDIIVLAVMEQTELSGEHRMNLRRLLGEQGGVLFPQMKWPPTVQSIRGAILECQHLPAGPDGLRVDGSDYLRTRGGALIIDNHSARLLPADGSAPSVIQDDVAIDPTGKRTRCAVAVAEELDDLHARLGASFNATQAAVLAQRRLVAPPAAVPYVPFIPGPRKTEMLGGTLQYVPPEIAANDQYSGGGPFMWILPNGALINNPWQLDSATGLPFPPAPTPRRTPFQPATVLWLVAEGELQTVMGLILLVCGVILLSGVRIAGRLHAAWAWAKLGILVLELALLDRCLRDLKGSPQEPGLLIRMVSAMIGASIYPIVVLLVIRGKRSRGFFGQFGAEVDLVADSTRIRIWPGIWAILRKAPARTGLVVFAFTATAAATLHFVAAMPGGKEPAWMPPMGGRVDIGILCALAAWMGVFIFLLTWRNPRARTVSA